MNSSLLAVHRVLEYLLTKIALTGTLKSTKVRIPYHELLSGVGKETRKDIDLIVKISFEWDETKGQAKDIVSESLADDLEPQEGEDE
jgi:hypothetical protein